MLSPSKEPQDTQAYGNDEVHLQVLKKIADEAAKTLFVMFVKTQYPVKFPRVGKEETALIFKRREKRQGSTGWLISALCLARSWSRSCWNYTTTTWKTHRWLMTDNMASLRANQAWNIWWLFTVVLQHWWTREEQLTSPTWTCEKIFTVLTKRCWGKCFLTSLLALWITGLSSPSASL